MKLIGMLDSPYVRRVAVSLQLLGVPFEHQSLSVFRTFDQFRQINPVVKAPTLVTGDGTSTLGHVNVKTGELDVWEHGQMISVQETST